MTGVPFTEAGAWNYIADLLETGHECIAQELDKPPGTIGYVLIADGYAGYPKTYIKVTMSGHYINGRSFHLSEY
jgi:hypothetical protein